MRTIGFLGVLVLSLVTAQIAGAASVSTGMADWQLVELPAGAPGTIGTAPVITTPNGAWNNSLAVGGVKWIGPTKDANLVGLEGTYKYELSLVLPAGTYALNAAFTSDNMVASFKLNGIELLPAPQTDTYSFKKTFNVAGQGTSPLTLDVEVINSPLGGSASNPTGLIVSGNVTAVPLPAAAWAGMGLLGALGSFKVLRRRAA